MGIIYLNARNLIDARAGMTGGKAVTLGRLTVYLHPRDLSVLKQIAPKDPACLAWFDAYRWGDFAEDFFRDVLKFDTADSIDFSDYQGASLIHDLGEPLPLALAGAFDLAVDGGTLEHIFNFPVAIANLMKLVRVGGVVYLSGPCNNLCGHGFYQFSPELMHRLFCAANGFDPVFVRVAKAKYVSVELTSVDTAYDVRDPNQARERVNLITSAPTLIMVMARRTSDVEPLRAKTLQSDYVAAWDAGAPHARAGAARRLKAALRTVLPTRAMNHVMGLNQRRRASLADRGDYRRVR